MFNASLIDKSNLYDFPIGGLLVKIPALPRVGEELRVNGTEFCVDRVVHSINTSPVNSYKAIIYLARLGIT